METKPVRVKGQYCPYCNTRTVIETIERMQKIMPDFKSAQLSASFYITYKAHRCPSCGQTWTTHDMVISNARNAILQIEALFHEEEQG